MDPLHERELASPALDKVAKAAAGYLSGLDDRLVADPAAAELLAELRQPLPEDGLGTLDSVEELLRIGTTAATHSAGPRFFHFVIGGATPAAMAGDWVAALLDQNAGLWTSSQFATMIETVTLGWLKDLFGLPNDWGGVLTPSATFANLTGLAAARQWWGNKHGRDISADGLAGLPTMPVFSGGYVHASVRKALQILGAGRDTVTVCSRDDAGRVDLDGLADELDRLNGPAVIVGCAGEVNAGDFDPIDAMADLAEKHGCWLHVDGAFGLFAALSPRTAHLVDGMQRADSVAADAHNGSTFLTRADLCSSATRGRSPKHSAPGTRPIWRQSTTARSTTTSSGPSLRGAPAPCRSGRRCAPTGAPATGRWSNAIST